MPLRGLRPSRPLATMNVAATAATRSLLQRGFDTHGMANRREVAPVVLIACRRVGNSVYFAPGVGRRAWDIRASVRIRRVLAPR
jgi:hypothetical protein